MRTVLSRIIQLDAEGKKKRMRFFSVFTPRPTEYLQFGGINSTLEGDENMHTICRLKQIKGKDKLVDQY